MTGDEWIALGVFTQPHGVSGRIKVKSLGDGPEDFAAHPTLTDAHGTPIKLRITGHAQGMSIVEIEGITSREQAEKLRGKKIGVPRAALPAHTNPNRFYIRDLVGLTAFTVDGTRFGEVIDVVNYGASDILVIRTDEGDSDMFAFTHATFPAVDLVNKRITIDPPEVIGAEGN